MLLKDESDRVWLLWSTESFRCRLSARLEVDYPSLGWSLGVRVTPEVVAFSPAFGSAAKE